MSGNVSISGGWCGVRAIVCVYKCDRALVTVSCVITFPPLPITTPTPHSPFPEEVTVSDLRLVKQNEDSSVRQTLWVDNGVSRHWQRFQQKCRT